MLIKMQLAKELEDLPNTCSILIITPLERLQENTLGVMKALGSRKVPGVYVSLNKPYKSVQKIFKDNGIDTGKMFFIDCIASKDGKAELEEGVLHIDDPTDLRLLKESINSYIEAMKGERFLVIDALSTLLIYNNRNEVAKFAKSLTESASEYNTLAVALSPKTGDSELLAYIFNFFDKVIQAE